MDLSDRKTAVLKALHAAEKRPAPAAVVKAIMDETHGIEHAAQGIGQTLRRLAEQDKLVELVEDGWKFTEAGAAKVRRLVAS